MIDQGSQLVLRCDRCNKPFDKQSTLKRHGYYCRSRAAPAASRVRSCVACARAKVRCDALHPSCSRCVNKSLDCHYVAPARARHSRTGQALNRTDADASVDQVESSTTGPDQGSSQNEDLSLDDIIFGSDMDLADSSTISEAWNAPKDDLTRFSDWTSLSFNDSRSRSAASLNSLGLSTPQSFDSSLPQIPPNISFARIRSLVLRSTIDPEAHRIAGLTLHALKSYPMMMIQHQALPPYIHPRSLDTQKEHLEPFANCISLTHMLRSGTQSSRKLFWKNVRMECERFCEELPNFDTWELLAAMQALSIYILYRIAEGETEHNNLDFLMVTTVILLTQQIRCRDDLCNVYFPTGNRESDREWNWKAWMLEESRRRIGIVFRVLNMLIYFEPAALCELQMDLLLAPLPANKQLWEATSETSWRTENEKLGTESQPVFALSTKGDLVRLNESQLHCSDTLLRHELFGDIRSPTVGTNAAWEEWCSGMDAFGGLIMMATTLQHQLSGT